jgi:Mce-associated membrane protein
MTMPRPFSMLLRLPRIALALAVVEVLAAAIGATAWYQNRQSDQGESAGHNALAAATAATQALFSYDYRNFDASVSNGRQFVTGSFAEEYADTTTSLKATAVKEQAVVQAQVSAASVVTASPDRVEVLLFVNQYRKNANITGEKVDQNRVVLTLVPAGGHWKVVQAQAV